jgi:hypothetical protein
MGDLVGEDFDLAQKDNLYRWLDKLLVHKTALFSFLQQAGRPCSRPNSKSCSTI